jgi:tetratricopeptide (TPR) repeat protein
MKISLIILLFSSLIFLSSFNFIFPNNFGEYENELVQLEEDFFASPELENSYKTKIIKKVFAQLKMVKGDFRSIKPQLNFVDKIPNGGRIAVAFGKIGLVFFEEKTYDLCASLGKDSLDAMAIILGHELTHCYENHDWEDHFKQEFKKTQMDSVLKDHYMEDEIQADYLGGFLAYSAGFHPVGVTKKIFTSLYKAYDITDEELEGDYPPLNERIEIAEKSDQKLKALIDYFEMANFLVALGEYEDALVYYNAVEREFQSREIYNNLGVIAFLSAVEKISATQLPFAFPVELDANSRLSKGGRGGNEDQVAKLMEAIEYFEKAKTMDAFYPIAWLNLGCARALLGFVQDEYQDLEYDEAELAAKRAIRLAKGEDPERWKKSIIDANILLGVIEGLRINGDIQPLMKEIAKLREDDQNEEMTLKIESLKDLSEDAIMYFDRALKLDENAQLAHLNKNKLESKKIPTPPAVGQLVTPTETIEGKKIVELRVRKENIRKDLLLKPGMIFAVKNYAKSQLFVNSVSVDPKHTTNLYVTNIDYDQTTHQGVKIGDHYDTVTEKYPNPPTPIGLGDGYFLVYRNPMLIFQFDADHNVKRWAIYRR